MLEPPRRDQFAEEHRALVTTELGSLRTSGVCKHWRAALRLSYGGVSVHPLLPSATVFGPRRVSKKKNEIHPEPQPSPPPTPPPEKERTRPTTPRQRLQRDRSHTFRCNCPSRREGVRGRAGRRRSGAVSSLPAYAFGCSVSPHSRGWLNCVSTTARSTGGNSAAKGACFKTPTASFTESQKKIESSMDQRS